MEVQPNFDDERTVLTARPVVPLEQIDTRVKHRRRWFLGGAFAVAMLLGAISALISAYFKFRNIPDPEIQALSVSQPVVEIVPEQPAKPKLRNRDKTNRTDRPATRVAPVIEPRLSEEEELRRIRDAVLVDEWQERRQRRVERRERPRAQHHDRDLSNIDEIFEGRRRP